MKIWDSVYIYVYIYYSMISIQCYYLVSYWSILLSINCSYLAFNKIVTTSKARQNLRAKNSIRFEQLQIWWVRKLFFYSNTNKMFIQQLIFATYSNLVTGINLPCFFICFVSDYMADILSSILFYKKINFSLISIFKTCKNVGLATQIKKLKNCTTDKLKCQLFENFSSKSRDYLLYIPSEIDLVWPIRWNCSML